MPTRLSDKGQTWWNLFPGLTEFMAKSELNFYEAVTNLLTLQCILGCFHSDGPLYPCHQVLLKNSWWSGNYLLAATDTTTGTSLAADPRIEPAPTNNHRNATSVYPKVAWRTRLNTQVLCVHQQHGEVGPCLIQMWRSRSRVCVESEKSRREMVMMLLQYQCP